MVHRVPFTKLIHHPNKPLLVLSNGSHFLAVNTSTGEMEKSYPQDSETKKSCQEAFRNLDFSKDGDRLATSGDSKDICVYDTSNWQVLSTRPAYKRVNALQFTKDASTVVAADKFGDVYCHPTKTEASDEKLEPIVGHVSMITDVILSDDEKYVITADRDEHIRVSRFPNGYNIETFCLGHTDVVTVIRLLPWNKDILLSAGGDNTICTWDFVKGTRIQSLNYEEHVKQFIPPASETGHVDNPIVSSVKFDNKSNTVAVSFTKIPAIMLLEWNQDEKTLQYKSMIITDRNILDIAFDLEGRLWASLVPTAESDDLMAIFAQADGKYQRIPSDSSLLKSVNTTQVELVDTLPDLYSLLGLRKYYEQFEEDDSGKIKKKKKTG